MTNDWRTVLDTGVVVSAILLPRSVPRQAFDSAVSRGKLLVSDQTIAELDEVLRRPKFDKYVSESQRLEFLAATLIFPLLLMVGDKFSKDAVAWIAALFS